MKLFVGILTAIMCISFFLPHLSLSSLVNVKRVNVLATAIIRLVNYTKSLSPSDPLAENLLYSAINAYRTGYYGLAIQEALMAQMRYERLLSSYKVEAAAKVMNETKGLLDKLRVIEPNLIPYIDTIERTMLGNLCINRNNIRLANSSPSSVDPSNRVNLETYLQLSNLKGLDGYENYVLAKGSAEALGVAKIEVYVRIDKG